MKTNEMFRFKVHSVVDVITNSSTVIYTYQDGCEEPAKELINEMLKLSGIIDKKAEDLFYIGTFCEDRVYFERIDEEMVEGPDDYPEVNAEWRSIERDEQEKIRNEWFKALQISIMKGETKRPEWMESCEENYDGWNPSTEMVLMPRDEKYADFGRKISDLLNGISADGGREG